MTSSAAENRAGEKEKMEKRRALGRGLASLLPGPRVVGPAGTGAEAPDISQAGVVDAGGSNAAGTRAGVPSTIAQGGSAPHLGAGDEGTSLRSAGQPMAAVPTSAVPVSAVPTSGDTASGIATSGIPISDVLTPGTRGEMLLDEDRNPATIMAMADPSRVPANLVINISIHDIDKNPFQTRYVEDDDKLEELADSIKTSGVVQPILVRPSDEDEDRYILVMGERRLHASKKAGKTTIPAMVRKLSPQQAAEMTIIENLQREDLSPLEQAQAFKVLSQEFAMTQAQIAERVGLSRESVSNYMRLLKLPREVMEMLAEKRISFAKAKELLKLEGNDRIAEAALYAVEKGMNIEQIEMLVLRMDGMLPPLPDMPGVVKEKKPGVARWVDPNVRAAQVELERLLGVRVRIRDRKGRGKIVIEYATVDDYDRVVGMLRGK